MFVKTEKEAGVHVRVSRGLYQVTCGRCDNIQTMKGDAARTEKTFKDLGWIPGREHHNGLKEGWVCPNCSGK